MDEENGDFQIPVGLRSQQFKNYLLSSPLGGINLLATSDAIIEMKKSMIEMAKNSSSQNHQHHYTHADECCSGEDSATTATTTSTTSASNNTPPSRKTTPVRTHVLTNGRQHLYSYS